MIRGIFILLAFASTVLFPWICTVLLTLGLGLVEPLLPLAIGLFADTLYYAPESGLPLFTLYGLLATVLVFLVRTRLKTGIIRR